MSIGSASILKDGTISVTGGTATAMLATGSNMDQVQAVFDGTSFVDRSSARFSVKPPSAQASAPSGYTQARNEVYVKVPITLADGTVVFNTVNVKMSFDVATTAAQKDTVRGIIAQIVADTDFDGFWRDQVLA